MEALAFFTVLILGCAAFFAEIFADAFFGVGAGSIVLARIFFLITLAPVSIFVLPGAAIFGAVFREGRSDASEADALRGCSILPPAVSARH